MIEWIDVFFVYDMYLGMTLLSRFYTMHRHFHILNYRFSFFLEIRNNRLEQ